MINSIAKEALADYPTGGNYMSIMLMSILCLVHWRVGLTGVRVGEASNPGPETPGDGWRIGSADMASLAADVGLSIVTSNVTSMWTQSANIASMDAHVVMLQETRLNAWAQTEMQRDLKEAGWILHCGKP